MADFDPTQYGATAVEDTPQPFDPTAHGAIPVQEEERSIPSKIGHAVLDTVKGLLPQSVEEAALAPITMVPGIGRTGRLLSNIAFGKPIAEGLDPLAGIPVAQRIPQIAAAEKTAPYSQERFTAGIGTLADVAMLAGFKEGLQGKIPTLGEVFKGKAEPATPMEAAVEPTPTGPIVTPPNEPTGISQPQIEPSEATSAGQKLGAQFEDLRTQAADLQERINAQREAQPVSEAQPATTAPLSTEATRQDLIDQEVKRYQTDYLDTAKRFDEHAAEATDPETKAGLQKIADSHRAEAERAATPEFIKTFIEPKIGEPNAIQEPSPREILQRKPEETGTPGSERGRVEPSVQGEETPQAGQAYQGVEAGKVAEKPEGNAVWFREQGAMKPSWRTVENAKDVSLKAAPDHEFFVYKGEGKGGKWYVVEKSTGTALNESATKQAAIDKAESQITKRGVGDFEKDLDYVRQQQKSPSLPAFREQTSPVSVPTETTTSQPLPQTKLTRQGSEAGTQETPDVKPPVETPAATGVHAAALEERPINAPPPGEVTGWEANTEQGHQWLDSGGDPNTIIQKFAETKAVTPDDMGRMRAALQRLQAGTDAAGDALRKDPGNPELETAYQTANDAEQRFTDAFKPMHTFASANLSSLQGKVPFDEGAAKSFTGMHREFQANMGREFTTEEAAKADTLVNKNTEAAQKYQNANKELIKTADESFKDVPSVTKGRAPTIQELGQIFAEKLKEVCDL